MKQTSEKTFKSNTELFYAAVRAEYAKMTSVKTRKGTPVLDLDYILEELGDKFFRSPKTIENIVFNRVAVKKARPAGIPVTLPTPQTAHRS